MSIVEGFIATMLVVVMVMLVRDARHEWNNKRKGENNE